MAANSSWEASFPADPDVDTGKFFCRFAVFVLAGYCQSRGLCPESAFQKRKIEGRRYTVFNPSSDVGKTFFNSLKSYGPFFEKNLIEKLDFVILSDLDVVEIITFRFNCAAVSCSSSEVSQCTPLEKHNLDGFKTHVYGLFDRVAAVARILPPIANEGAVISFRLLMETTCDIIENEGTSSDVFSACEPISLPDSCRMKQPAPIGSLILNCGANVVVSCQNCFTEEFDSSIQELERTKHDESNSSMNSTTFVNTSSTMSFWGTN